MTLGRDKRFAPRSRILHGIGLFALPLPIIFLIILAATPLSGQATEPAAQGDGATLEKWIPRAVLEADFPVSAEEMLGHVHFLAHDRLRGRDAGSREEELAATYIAAELRKLGLEPAGDDGGWEQAFGLIRVVRAEGGPRVEKLTSRNVLAWLPGSDESLAGEYIVFGAHFDHLGADGEGQIYNGADDNASGVAGMLAVARACARGAIRPRRSILFVAFGAEERGLGGSRHLVSHPPRPLERLAAMINLDMIGRKSFLDRAPLRMAKAYVGIRPGPGVG
ncbi:MAG: M20/M25/M40 family metallo-hydrolase, partial [Planctomycetota bacterium]